MSKRLHALFRILQPMLLLVFVVCLLFYIFLGWRLILPAQLGLAESILAWSVLALPFLMFPGGFLLRSRVSGTIADLFSWVSYTCMGLLILLLSITLLRDLIWMGAFLIDLVLGLVRSDWRVLPTDPERRNLLLNSMNAGIAGASVSMTAFGFYHARRRPQVREVKVKVPNLHSDLEGFRIVQLSDIHLGPTIKGPFFRQVIEVVNTLNADLVAITGDLIDDHVAQLSEDVAPITELKSRHGTFFATGNHEYYWDAVAWIDHLTSLGVPVLTNTHRTLEHQGARLLVAGVNDYSAARIIPSHASDPHKAVEHAPATDFKLLLAHQPKSVYEASKAGFDLQLSGHTHGGQFYPWNIVVGMAHPFVAGLHPFENMKIYVSRGTGYWGPPLRLGAPSEITLLILTAA